MKLRTLKVEKKSIDKTRGIYYCNIKNISLYDLEKLWRLLEAERARCLIVHGLFRGSQALLFELRKMAEERGWIKHKLDWKGEE